MNGNALNPWIETFTGKKFYFGTPRKKDVDIKDVAHGLALMCRYTCQCREFYSVAEHSVLCSNLFYQADPPLSLQALVHDAHEAYVGDVNKPLKTMLPDYQDIETVVSNLVCKTLTGRLPSKEERKLIKAADVYLLMKEAEFLLPSGGSDWLPEDAFENAVDILSAVVRPEAFKLVRIAALEPQEAEDSFLAVYSHLMDYLGNA